MCAFYIQNLRWIKQKKKNHQRTFQKQLQFTGYLLYIQPVILELGFTWTAPTMISKSTCLIFNHQKKTLEEAALEWEAQVDIGASEAQATPALSTTLSARSPAEPHLRICIVSDTSCFPSGLLPVYIRVKLFLRKERRLLGLEVVRFLTMRARRLPCMVFPFLLLHSHSNLRLRTLPYRHSHCPAMRASIPTDQRTDCTSASLNSIMNPKLSSRGHLIFLESPISCPPPDRCN